MTESMIERVAQALAKESGVSNWANVSEHGDYDSRDYWRRLARSSIAAMRKPGAWMVDEMCGAWMRNNREKLGVLMLRYWEAAIDAALVDDPGNPETQAIIDAALSETTP